MREAGGKAFLGDRRTVPHSLHTPCRTCPNIADQHSLQHSNRLKTGSPINEEPIRKPLLYPSELQARPIRLASQPTYLSTLVRLFPGLAVRTAWKQNGLRSGNART